MFVKGRGCGKGREKEGGGGFCYNVIKIRWPPRDSVCFCLLNLIKMGCKNRQAVEVLRLLSALFSESFPALRRRISAPSGLPAFASPQSRFCTNAFLLLVHPL